jgi:hypothetical protein
VAVAVIVPDPPRAIDVPFTVNEALASRACANVPLEMLVALILETLAPDPFNVPTKFPDVVLPVTASAVSVPTEVMLGCAAVVTVPAVVALVAVPADPDILPVIVAVTVSPDNVPTEVMLGCAAVVTVPAVVAEVALVAAPLKVAVIVPALKLPLASRATIALAVFALVAVDPNVTAPVDALAVIPPPLAKLATPA